jgi:hypothetical protein
MGTITTDDSFSVLHSSSRRAAAGQVKCSSSGAREAHQLSLGRSGAAAAGCLGHSSSWAHQDKVVMYLTASRLCGSLNWG